MNTNKALTLSIVIPVYNEQHHIRKCLEAIAAQTVMPDEVVIVDNNSTDSTIKIAKDYPFVRVISESRQGRAFARSAGFDAATGDIVGRIDADSVLTPGWSERVLSDFADSDIGGVTGLGKTNVILGLNGLYTTFWSRVYFWTTHSFFGGLTMWGANMAIRRSAWQSIRSSVTLDDSVVHEDQDMSLVLLGHGITIAQDNKLLIESTGRSYLYWPKFWEYFTRMFRTRSYHKQRHTFPPNSPLELGFLNVIPGAIIGWFFTLVFLVYSFISWPITAYLKRTNNLH